MAAAAPTAPVAVLNFGKFKGASLDTVPEDYLEWLAGYHGGYSQERLAREKVDSLVSQPAFLAEVHGINLSDVPASQRPDYVMTLLVSGVISSLPSDPSGLIPWYWVARNQPQTIAAAKARTVDVYDKVACNECVEADEWIFSHTVEEAPPVEDGAHPALGNCRWCSRRLVPIGAARRNGRAGIRDWSNRKFHVKCYKEFRMEYAD